MDRQQMEALRRFAVETETAIITAEQNSRDSIWQNSPALVEIVHFTDESISRIESYLDNGGTVSVGPEIISHMNPARGSLSKAESYVAKKKKAPPASTDKPVRKWVTEKQFLVRPKSVEVTSETVRQEVNAITDRRAARTAWTPFGVIEAEVKASILDSGGEYYVYDPSTKTYVLKSLGGSEEPLGMAA